ncbi:hypothetical protein BDY21DRAFT_173906 [Lineolata rhizophorae]|uniref:Fungal-specific transcription factor domain-containing protein n=1 Tax=Lineolata rhizophorae TaxID=578093 RepID=A0A6A6NM43_9PEZI|nr:hypothetical protein BDY21DRAFT_173906 [Lineolata rhizophorae]
MAEQDPAERVWPVAPPSPYSLAPVSTNSSTRTDDEGHENSTKSVRDISLALPSSLDQQGVGWPLGNRKEARCFMHFIDYLAQWVDVCDPRRHFGTEVPRRACEHPLLTYALLAFSSHHLSILSGYEDDSPARYYSSALQILIPILDGPINALNEDILAAIVLLRLYEEMLPDVDTGTHLFGSSRILNSMSSFAAKGGLGEAASWIVLRQDIYFSLTKSQPLYIQLESYKMSSSFTDNSAESLANRAVFLCAQLLAYAFHCGADLDVQLWNELNEEVEKWYETKPWQCTPLWVGPQGSSGSAFPSIWMIRPAHIVGYQHNCLARVLLAIFNPHLCKPGFETFSRRREADDAALGNLRMLIGLAISNPSVVNATLLASHALQACGSYLKDPEERKEAIEFLEDVRKRTGWHTSRIVNNLTAQWSQSTNANAFGHILMQ